MDHDFLPNSPDWYAGREFVYSESTFRNFYLSMYEHLQMIANRRGYVNGKRNFKDIFQEAMIKFYQLAKSGFLFKSYDDAVGMAVRMFLFAMVNDYRKNKRTILLYFPDSIDLYVKEEVVNPAEARQLPRMLEQAFGEMDIAIRKDPGLLRGKQLEFYELYRTMALHSKSNHDVVEIITTKMKISKNHFRKLKSEVKAIFMALLSQLNIFIHK